MEQNQGKVITPRQPDIVRDTVERLGKAVHDTLVRWAAQKLGKMEVEVEGLLSAKKLAVLEEPLGNGKLRVILYEKVGEVTIDTTVKADISTP